MDLLINLTEGFGPFDHFRENFKTQEVEAFTFSGGEPHIKLKVNAEVFLEDSVSVMITQKIKSFNDLGLLLLTVDALRRTYTVESINLFLPYFPGARQDRAMVLGEPLTSKIYAEQINALNLDSVIIMDSHSDVVPALLNNCTNWDNHNFISTVLAELPSGITLISPDAGANKKILKLAQAVGISDIVKCDKTRNVNNGQITGFEVYANDLTDKNCLIVDDICDGGGTFIGLAQELIKKGAAHIYLAVSHGIFSKGMDGFSAFEKVFSTDSFIDESNDSKLTIIPLKNMITL